MSFSDIDELLLECPICLEPFKKPKFLPVCGHSFCLSCLADILDSFPGPSGHSVACPICSRTLQLPEKRKRNSRKSVKKLPDSQLISRLKHGASKKEILTCKKCRRVLDGPKTLPFCQHSFCSPCLAEILHEGVQHGNEKLIRCPECQAGIRLRMENGKDLPSPKACLVFFPTDYVLSHLLS